MRSSRGPGCRRQKHELDAADLASVFDDMVSDYARRVWRLLVEVSEGAPILARDRGTRLEKVIEGLESEPGDDVILRDQVVLWVVEKRIITGVDPLGSLLRGFSRGMESA